MKSERIDLETAAAHILAALALLENLADSDTYPSDLPPVVHCLASCGDAVQRRLADLPPWE